LIKKELKEYFSFYYILAFFSVLITIFYIICSSPGYGWRDGPELAVTVTYLDIAHSSGFPTYNLLAKILTWLPFGALAFRATIFTALAGGLTIFLLGLLLKQLHDLRDTSPCYLFLLAPLIFFALHQAFFIASTEVEVYSLNTAMILALLLCALRWRQGHGVVWLYIGGFLYGLSCGNHASLALYLPVLLLLTFWTWPDNELRPKSRDHLTRLTLLSIIFLVGLSVYVFLLVRSQTDRLPVDFGRTNTWARFWSHISDAKDKETHFKGLLNYQELFYFLKIHFQNLSSPLFWLGFPFAIWGLRYLWKTYQILSVALVVLIGINSFFFYYWIDGTSAFLPTLVCFFILLGLGLGEFGRVLSNHKVARQVAFAVLALVLVVSCLITIPKRYRESDSQSGFLATEIFWPDLANLPPDAMTIQHSQWFSLLALQHLYVTRPDVVLVSLAGVFHPEFFVPPLPAKMPGVLFPTLADGSLLPVETDNYFSYFIAPNMEAGRPVYLQYGQEIQPVINYMTPEKPFQWVGRLTKDKWMIDKAMENDVYLAYLVWFRNYISQMAVSKDPPLAAKAPAYMIYIVNPIMRLVASRKYYQEAILTAETLLNSFTRPDGTILFPMDVTLNLHAFLANTYRVDKNFLEALKYIKKLISLSPYNPDNYYILGLIYENMGNGEETLAAWRTSTELDKYNVNFFYHYHIALAKYESISAAVKFLEERAQLFKEDNMDNLYKLAIKFRDCLLLPPEEFDVLPGFEDLKENGL
jgi:tetratricopeptide (TPR) repeat protein